MSKVVPYLFYRDAPAAIDFLTRAFGFVEEYRFPMDDGRIGHAELALDDAALMLASTFEGFGTSPLDLPAVHCQIRCTVDDVDAHYERARRGGATIVTEPESHHGSRMYRAMDLEGHRWIFGTPLAQA